jgi:uncharacterized protein DUF6786
MNNRSKLTIALNSRGIALVFVCLLFFWGCKSKKEDQEGKVTLTKGTFAYDLNFLRDHYDDLVFLKNGESQLIVSPALQGRVMTSTANGAEGQSFGWLNYDLISSKKKMPHFNPIGGEERFWLGPEGGQFSVYFKPETTFDFENWYVPKELDTEAFNLIGTTNSEASFEKRMQLVNYSGTVLTLKVNRKIKLLEEGEISKSLGIDIPKGISMVGFESENTLTNSGENIWDKKSGTLSIWILSMLNSNEGTTIIIPYKTGGEKELGKIVTDDYFGKVSKERLIVLDSVLLFKGDGKERGKIGVSPQRAKPLMGSYDAVNKVLTVAKFTLPEGETDYVNSQWALQEHPFAGDAVNSYNDGPLDDGTQLGPFYELESSSPAAALKPKESLVHKHQTYHFEGDEIMLDHISKQLFGVSMTEL